LVELLDRRAFLGTLSGSLAVPVVAHAQAARRLRRVGVLGLSPTSASMAGPDPKNPFANAFVRGMRELGYVYGEHFVTEVRGAEGKPERYPTLVAELLRLNVEVFVAVAASVRSVQRATTTIPIVMTGSEDPVGAGLVSSLGRPGGNTTGLSLQTVELTAKRLDLLKQLVTTPAPVAVVFEPTGRAYWQAAEVAARQRSWKLLPLEIQDAEGLDAALRKAAAARASSVVMNAGLVLDPNPTRAVELVASSRLPAIYRFEYYAQVGGLMSYGADLVDSWRRAAGFVDKILKGARPGDLPIEQPSRFELCVNVKTARTLGLAISPALLQRADKIVE
jgi:putative ABC transport system substrate-binding protein